MSYFVRAGIVLASLILVQAADAQTRSKLLDATDPERVAETIRDLGYRAQLSVEEGSRPSILSSVGGSEFYIYFNTCNDDYEECQVLLFAIGYDLNDGTTLETVEAFNENTLIGRAYIDDENDPWLEYAVNMYGGVTRTNFADSFDWWEVILGQFEEHIGLR